MGSNSKPSRGHWFLFLGISVLILLANLALLIWAGHFLDANYRHLPPLPDLVHDVLPVWDVRFLVHIGLFTSLILFVIGVLKELPKIPFFMVGFWFLVRTVCTIITPLGVPADLLSMKFIAFEDIKSFGDLIVSSLSSHSVLFFSGHTGLPFLGYLLFRKSIRIGSLMWPMLLISGMYLFSFDYPLWLGGILALIWGLIFLNRKKTVALRFVFLIWSFIMASAVLLMRGHYTIDIIGAYFMTAGIVFSGKYFFRKVEWLCDKMEKHF